MLNSICLLSLFNHSAIGGKGSYTSPSLAESGHRVCATTDMPGGVKSPVSRSIRIKRFGQVIKNPDAIALNSLVLRQRRGFVVSWYIAGALCTVFAFFLVLLQCSVSEWLYGIE